MTPTFFIRLAVTINSTFDGWIKCPAHGYQHDMLKHGYHGCMYYLRCQVPDCNYTVDI